MCPKWQLRYAALAAALSMTGAGWVMAQAPTQTQTNPSSSAAAAATADTSTTASKADRAFVRRAAEGNAAEVALGRLAEQQSQDPDVKAFGERMVKDHSQANDQLASVAQSLNMTMPTSPSKAEKTQMDKLASLSGADFDKAFAREMVADHRTVARAFEREAKTGHDPQVKEFAQSTLPTIREHLALAEKLPGAR
jgi:putative membrane protein